MMNLNYTVYDAFVRSFNIVVTLCFLPSWCLYIDLLYLIVSGSMKYNLSVVCNRFVVFVCNTFAQSAIEYIFHSTVLLYDQEVDKRLCTEIWVNS